ncbi:MAG: hypothetical protein JOY93_08715 [Acidobacteriales bacterium]|nr:hypothetical protein [Terriglobales bacterium]
MPFNPALNLGAFSAPEPPPAPPVNVLYLQDGKYDPDEHMSRDNVAKTFRAFRDQTATPRLALFFHGGLVDKSTGTLEAARHYDAYKDFVFPLFFIWESGFFDVLSHQLPLIFAEPVFRQVALHATDVISPKLSGGSSNTGDSEMKLKALDLQPSGQMILSDADIANFMNAIKDDELIQHEAAAIARTSRSIDSLLSEPALRGLSQLSPRTYLSPEVISAIRGAYAQSNPTNPGSGCRMETLPFDPVSAVKAAWAVAKASVPVLTNCVRRFRARRDHGMTCTIVEEILRALYVADAATFIWQKMKQETEHAFGADSSIYGGTAVLEELCELLEEKPETPITLVGHSTGAVYIGNFLRHADQMLNARRDNATEFDIILMAPACTMDFYAANYAKRVRGIRIFQMNDATEREDHLMSRDYGNADTSILGNVYPRSLLYLVSGICEDFGITGTGAHAFDRSDMPLLGMDRFYAETAVFNATDYPTVEQIRQRFAAAPPPTRSKFVRVLSPNSKLPDDGFRSMSHKHGNFPSDDATQNSIRFCFKYGL